MKGDDNPGRAASWWTQEAGACPAHLVAPLHDALAQRHYREGRFLALMGLILGFASLIIDALIVPEEFWLIAALRLIPTIPLQLAALAMPFARLSLQKFFIGASLCTYAISMVYASRLAPPGPATIMAFGPIILLGVAIPLLPFTRRQLAVFVIGYAAPVGALVTHLNFGSELTTSLLIVLGMVALGSSVIALRLRRLERQEALMTLLAQDRARNLEESNKRLTQLSMQDPLTDLANRRWTESAFERSYSATADEAPGQTALLLLDLDHFKDFNDHWGHDLGDRCLKAVAEVIRHAAGSRGGLAARIGGEEFVILLRADGVAAANALAEEVRLGVERIELRLDDSGLTANCTTSIGVAVHKAGDRPVLTDLLKRADEALYEAKREGRNRFKLAA